MYVLIQSPGKWGQNDLLLHLIWQQLSSQLLIIALSNKPIMMVKEQPTLLLWPSPLKVAYTSYSRSLGFPNTEGPCHDRINKILMLLHWLWCVRWSLGVTPSRCLDARVQHWDSTLCLLRHFSPLNSRAHLGSTFRTFHDPDHDPDTPQILTERTVWTNVTSSPDLYLTVTPAWFWPLTLLYPEFFDARTCS